MKPSYICKSDPQIAVEEAVPLRTFLKIETPIFKTAAADTGTTFNVSPIAGSDKADWIGAISLSGTGAPVIATATGSEVRLASGATLPFPGGPTNTPPTRAGVCPVDFTYDFKTALVLAGAGGVRLFRQDSPS